MAKSRATKVITTVFAVLLFLYAAGGLAIFWAMHQPPETFGRVMKHMPDAVFLVAPFETMWTMPILAVVCIVLLSRGVSVYPLCLLFMHSRKPISMAEQHVLWWGGLRGALALALALSLPHTVPLRDAIVVATFGVAVFSIVIQGLTMPLLLRRLGFLPQKI